MGEIIKAKIAEYRPTVSANATDEVANKNVKIGVMSDVPQAAHPSPSTDSTPVIPVPPRSFMKPPDKDRSFRIE